MTLKNNRAPLLCYFKLCAIFHSHQWVQTGVPFPKRPIWLKNDDFFVPCDLEIWQMTLEINRVPFLGYFKLMHFIAIGEFKLELQSGNAQFGSKSVFCTVMTLKNNKAPHLSNIKLFASFYHHMWIQTGVTLWKWLNWVLTSVTLTFDFWPWPFAWTSLLIGNNFWKFQDDTMIGT